MNKYFLLAAIMLLTGCTSPPTPVAYQTPPLILPSDPTLAINALTPQSKPDEIIKAWVATAVAYRAWNKIVRKEVEDINK